MPVNRRRFLGTAAFAGVAANGQVTHGIVLSEERLRVLAPVLARRAAQLETLRAFVIDDSVEPARGCS